MNTPRGLIIAAPASGSGKTVLTLGLLRALRNAGHGVTGAKAGPDYIDPAFHTAASGKPAMPRTTFLRAICIFPLHICDDPSPPL